MKMPKALGACVDLAYALQQEYLVKQKEADAAKAEVEAVKKHILDTFPKAGLEGGKGKVASVSIVRTVEPNVKDWDAVFSYVLEHDAWDLMYKRLNSKAYRDRLEAGDIPGVEQFTNTKLHLNKIGDK